MIIYYNFALLLLKTLFYVKCYGSFKIGHIASKIKGRFIKHIKLHRYLILKNCEAQIIQSLALSVSSLAYKVNSYGVKV